LVAEVLESSAAAAKNIDLDEPATRQLIDQQLRDAGWEVSSADLRHAQGVRPQKGKNLAIAEWPTASGPADYVLFVGVMPVAVVEAKRQKKNVMGALEQSKRYSQGFEAAAGLEMAGPWDGYRVPFLFATNGRPYLEQLKEKSGIWSLDARRKTNRGAALAGWPTPDGLRQKLKQDIDLANRKLDQEPTDYLGLRDYQVRAIRAVEEAIQKEQDRLLVAMATGTGKTRTAIGLIYRLLKSGRFRRVLFLVDRSALGIQTQNAFNEVEIENLQTFGQIFGIKELGELLPDADTKLQIATVQSMVRRLFDSADPATAPRVDDYDCIVIDEAHRGYGLDQELSESELALADYGIRSQDDYISKYRRVLEYFDAVKIALTATPAKQPGRGRHPLRQGPASPALRSRDRLDRLGANGRRGRSRGRVVQSPGTQRKLQSRGLRRAGQALRRRTRGSGKRAEREIAIDCKELVLLLRIMIRNRRAASSRSRRRLALGKFARPHTGRDG